MQTKRTKASDVGLNSESVRNFVESDESVVIPWSRASDSRRMILRKLERIVDFVKETVSYIDPSNWIG
jgi:hypothetical protein